MKIVNFVLGLATAVILGALINLGIAAFYPAPVAPSYPNTAVVAPVVPCASADAACMQNNAKIDVQQQAAQDQYNNAETAYEGATSVYDRNVFIIANIIGIVVFAIGFWLIFGIMLASNAVPVGIMLAGLWSIVYGYARGWGSVDDQLKFFIGLVIAVLIIGGSMWLIQRYQKNHGQNK
jgi:heme/copper-type cytochrome/quinol oxidase subunit 4